MQVVTIEQDEVILKCAHAQEEMAWDSEADSGASTTSTPNFK